MPLGSQGKLLCIYFWVFLPCGTRDLSSQPGIKPTPPAVEEQSLNHWTPREFPGPFKNVSVMKDIGPQGEEGGMVLLYTK